MPYVRLPNNSKHRIKVYPIKDEQYPYGVTACGIKFMLGQYCPDKSTHRIIFPNCPLHVLPVKCGVCYGV